MPIGDGPFSLGAVAGQTYGAGNSIPVGYASDQSALNMVVTIEPGALAGPPCCDFPTAEPYHPESLHELVRGTPSETIQRAIGELDHRRQSLNGRVIEPLPQELEWFNGAPLRSDALYTIVRQIVHMELERFAMELDKYFVFIPKSND